MINIMFSRPDCFPQTQRFGNFFLVQSGFADTLRQDKHKLKGNYEKQSKKPSKKNR
jgi:hypothetical protein